MRNLLKIKHLQGVQGVQRSPATGGGATLKNFFCIFFSISALRYFVNSKIWFKVVHFRAE